MPNPILFRRLAFGGAINPATLPFQELFFSGSTLNTGDDVLIPSWADLSGNGRNATQGTALQQPRTSIAGSAFNPDSPTGRKGANFNFGENDNLTGPLPGGTGLTTTRGLTFYCWYRESQFGTTAQTLWEDAVNGPRLVASSDTTSKIGFTDRNGDHLSPVTWSEGFHSYVLVMPPPQPTGIATLYYDGAIILQAAWELTNQFGPQNGFTLGNDRIPNRPFGGIIYQFMLFTDNHARSMVESVLQWGKGYWGF
jgi:hypothetical protein